MRGTRYSISRRKACEHCAAAKAKCDRQPGSCARCQHRGLTCVYSSGTTAGQDDTSPISSASPCASGSVVDNTSEIHYTSTAGDLSLRDRPSRPASGSASVSDPALDDHLDFSNMSLICPIRVDDIANRWLNSFFADAGQIPKQYPQTTSLFIRRILKSYVDRAIRGQDVPPFVHPTQIPLKSSLPLTTCLAVIRVCSGSRMGSTDIISELLNREMDRILSMQPSYDDMCLLAAFQAYLIYSMVIFFFLGRQARTSLQQAMMSLQSLACATSRSGLMCCEEGQGARPRWEHWIAAEAKRRTIMTMYLFDSVLLTEDGMQTYLGKELKGLNSPACKALWEASSRNEWTAGYNIHLAQWSSHHLQIQELWPIPEDEHDVNVEHRTRRVEAWLEGLDAFGTLVYAVTCSTHGA